MRVFYRRNQLLQRDVFKGMPIDPQAEALLARNEAAMLSLHSYAAECWTTTTSAPRPDRKVVEPSHQYATLIAVKPNLLRYQAWELAKDSNSHQLIKRKESPTYFFTCDGKRTFRQFGKRYRTDRNAGPEYMSTLLEPWGGFYTKLGSMKGFLESVKKENGKVHELSLLPAASVEGVPCEVVSYYVTASYEGKSIAYRGRLFIGPDRLVRRKVESVQIDGAPGFTQDSVLRKIRTNFPLPARQAFVYQPPDGVVEANEVREKARPLLANGKKAPDFTTLAPDGKPLKLSGFKGKVIVVDFWATWCGPCMQAMPSTNKIAREFKEKDVVVLGVNVWDEKNACLEWIKKNQASYESILFVHDPAGRSDKNIAASLFSVSGIPTQFVIDRNGIVRASFVGFNEDETPLRSAIEAAQKL